MYKITYYIGCNDKDTLKQELSDEKFISVFDSLFDNYTLSQAQGRFTKPVKEYSKVLDWGCTYKHREDIRNEYVKAITYALPLVETFKDMEV